MHYFTVVDRNIAHTHTHTQLTKKMHVLCNTDYDTSNPEQHSLRYSPSAEIKEKAWDQLTLWQQTIHIRLIVRRLFFTTTRTVHSTSNAHHRHCTSTTNCTDSNIINAPYQSPTHVSAEISRIGHDTLFHMSSKCCGTQFNNEKK